ncbi:FecR family protein [Desertivirga arenae]|uniref:FecR family protein n=1 Tax=Desertivirga arenae TaxID=2810309 RepID=UPI001A962517|nr:FecR domain-containing protein [Pedobacter sp. SYSU D00823]
MTGQEKERYLQELAKKWQEGTISEDEKREFEDWYNEFDDSYLELSDETPTALEQRMFQNIVEREKIEGPRIRSLSTYLIPVAAAVAVIFISVGLYLYHKPGSATEQIAVTEKIVPGSNKATLKLSDGREILLDDAKQGIIAELGNISIRKNQDGQVIYSVLPEAKESQSAKVSYNTISTPRGGQFQIELPDGTKVWLNAASSLVFPTHFNGKQRKVSLKGEAYFEVAKNKAKPFLVDVNKSTVEVLGTHFNIMGYEDERSTNTTLLEGSVKVTSGNRSELLTPGTEARVSGGITLHEVDPSQSVAWKNGLFVFDNESLGSIMRKLSRWYDVDIDIKGDIAQKHFGGTVSRFDDINDVLKIIELTEVIHFKIQERRIIVMP